MSNSIYLKIKDRISTRDAAEYYGHKVDRAGMMCCPFHQDRTPSMKVDQSFVCFSCNEKGDVIRFVSKLFDLTPYEAARKLDSDMCLGVFDAGESKPSPEQLDKGRAALAEQQRFNELSDYIYDVLCDYHRIIYKEILEIGPISANDELCPLCLILLHLRDAVEDLLDKLLYGTIEEKAQVVIKMGKGVASLEKRIREFEARYIGRAPVRNGSGPS